MKQITQEWIKSADADIKVVRAIIDDQELSHLVAFHCQQAIEKLFKAIIEEYKLSFIKTHSLQNLWGIIEDYFHTAIDTDVFVILDQLYIDASYPGALGLLPSGLPSKDEARLFYNAAMEIREIVIKILPANSAD